ncbi:hypothetical protein BZA70DRAFT_288141 [Myxozyma melibiosi]|uniref:DUF788-domain-containing protein n=1 Tax=Myxozyma melibiosi TaxID=54550 RepID=A0ABR1FA89_9ASCO
MANASVKKRAVANAQALKSLHTYAGAINLVYLLSYFVLHRPASLKPFVIFSIPAWIIEYQLERIGRPKFNPANGSLVSAGDDLHQAGLTEWLFDIVYVTLACDILAVIIGRSWVWFLYLVIPLYGSYMAYTSFIGPMLRQRSAAANMEDGPPAARTRAKKAKYVR